MSNSNGCPARQSQSLTGRDRFIAAKAFAYAIAVIESLPEQWQEWSDCQDMKTIFEAIFSKQLRETAAESVRFHLDGAERAAGYHPA